MNTVLRFATALAPLFAAWTVAASVAAIRTSRADLAASARRGLAAATACAAVAAIGLVAALVTRDFSVRFVAQTSSLFMPLRYVPSALLGAPGGALLAFGAVLGACGLGASAAAPEGTPAGDVARKCIMAVIGGAILVPLAAVAIFAAPFDALPAGHGEGAGLSPDLQRGAAGLRAVAFLLGTTFTVVSFAVTVGAVAARHLDDRWSRRVRTWTALAWTALFAGVVASARWYALNPVRGPWLAAQETALWLLPVATGAWLIHLDRGPTTADRVVTRILLIAATVVAATGAFALGGGAFVNGAAQRHYGHAGAWVALLPAAALILFGAQLRRSAGMLAGDAGVARPVPPAAPAPGSRAGAWIAHAGIVLLLGAALGSRYARVHTVALSDTQIFRAKDPFGHQWSFASQGVSTLQRENYASLTVSVLPERDGRRLGMLSAEARSYLLADGAESDAPAFTVGTLAGTFTETRLAVAEPDRRRPTVRITFVPLAPWAVPGALLAAIGTLLPLLLRREGRAS